MVVPPPEPTTILNVYVFLHSYQLGRSLLLFRWYFQWFTTKQFTFRNHRGISGWWRGGCWRGKLHCSFEHHSLLPLFFLPLGGGSKVSVPGWCNMHHSRQWTTHRITKKRSCWLFVNRGTVVESRTFQGGINRIHHIRRSDNLISLLHWIDKNFHFEANGPWVTSNYSKVG